MARQGQSNARAPEGNRPVRLSALFERFITERRFLKNITPKTEYSYHNAKAALCRLYGSDCPAEEVCKELLSGWVVRMRQAGLSPGACNVYIRTVNAFLRWGQQEGYLSAPAQLRVGQLRVEEKIIPTFTALQISRLLGWKPKTFCERRLGVLVALLLDTGLRIEEALTLRRSDVDLENLTLVVHGKGSKQRLVPMSFELRKILYRWLSRHQFAMVFPTRDGGRLRHRNTLQDFKELGAKLGIEGVQVSFHPLRHYAEFRTMPSKSRRMQRQP